MYWKCLFFLSPPIQANQALLPDHTLSVYVPRVYPFLSHTISSVRSSSLLAIKSLLNSRATNQDGRTAVWVEEVLDSLVCELFQRLLLEGDETIRNSCLEVRVHVHVFHCLIFFICAYVLVHVHIHVCSMAFTYGVYNYSYAYFIYFYM